MPNLSELNFLSPAGRTKWSLGFYHNPLLAVLLMAIIIRVLLALLPSEASNDEIFQYLEQAYRTTLGYGVIPWENRVGLRSGFIPILLSVPMHLGLLVPGSQIFLIITKLFVCALSLSIVISSFYIGNTISQRHAIWAALVMTFWPLVVYFSVHAQSETVALSLFLPACAIFIDNSMRRPAALCCAGILLTLTVIARIQMTPLVITIIIYYILKKDKLHNLIFVVGGLVAGLLISGICDILIGESPFVWAYRNVFVNLYEGKAAQFGTSPFYYYVLYFGMEWGAAALPIVFLAIVGGRRLPIIPIMALMHLLVHSLVAHKEIRFVLPVEVLTILSAALGTAEVLTSQSGSLRFARWSGLGALCLWGGSAASTAANEMNRYRWGEGWNRIQATSLASHVPDICGLAIYRTNIYNFGGYVTLNKKVNVYVFNPDAMTRDELIDGIFNKNTPSFNVIVTDKTMASRIPRDYHLVGCRAPIAYHPGTGDYPQDHTLCVFHRTSICIPNNNSPYLINSIFRQSGR